MSDLLERLTAANPVAEDDTPPIEAVWDKIDGARSRGRTWRMGGRALVSAAVALPVIGVLFLALVMRGTDRSGSHHAVHGVASGGSTLNRVLQAAALRALAGRDGALVVLDPRTGAVRALVGAGGDRTGPGTLWPPEATFDVVTAAAALDSGRLGPSSLISGNSPAVVSGTTVRNAGGAHFGPVTIGQALTFSINTAFARIGARLGAPTVTTYMRRFGFYASPGVGGIPASGVHIGGALVLPSAARVPVGALAAGQGGLTATALQMATVAATVANGGILVPPHLDLARTSIGGRRVISARTARLLTEMLRSVVNRGTGTAVDLAGPAIAGKTGTAAAGASGQGTVVSFIGFAPIAHPAVAVAVILRDPRGGFGGTVAAPIAARVIRTALGYGR